ncbi:MAG: aspartyl/asparaginyl beta-hydroxylase domain-containing protein [Planctomycetota bacterium]
MQLARRVAYWARQLMNRVYYRAVGRDRRPVFFDIANTSPALLQVERHYEAIRTELHAVLRQPATIPRYHEIDDAQRSYSAGERAWRVLFIHLYGVAEPLPLAERLPRTAALLRQIPGVLQAFFSILEPHKGVAAHCGQYLGALRYHMAFVVPRDHPPRMRIKDSHYEWREREAVLFDDSWEHEVHNDSASLRVVLIIDVMRPMPWPLHVCNLAMRELLFCRALTGPAVAKMPRPRRRA